MQQDIHSKHLPKYSVTEITNFIKRTLCSKFSLLKVYGEIFDCKQSRGGHWFFKLKDANNVIDAVCFANVSSNINMEIVDGLNVVVVGQLQIYNSKYHIRVSSIRYAGHGVLMKMLQDRKMRLSKLGLFDEARKKNIPSSFEIETIGIITSDKGAVLHDMICSIRDRFPKRIAFCNVAVQGNSATSEIIEAFQYLQNIKHGPEVIIIARGGGSVDNLFCFNDESLAIAVSCSVIPTISAIGHETDHTILDLVADLRVATPTAAAEIVTTPTLISVHDAILNTKADLNNVAQKIVNYAKYNALQVQRQAMIDSQRNFLYDDVKMMNLRSQLNCIVNIEALNVRLSDVRKNIHEPIYSRYMHVQKLCIDWQNLLHNSRINIYQSINKANNVLTNDRHCMQQNLYLNEDELLYKKKNMIRLICSNVQMLHCAYNSINLSSAYFSIISIIKRMQSSMTTQRNWQQLQIQLLIRSIDLKTASNATQLNNLNVKCSLKRGYNLASTLSGTLLPTFAVARLQSAIKLTFEDGDMIVKYENKN